MTVAQRQQSLVEHYSIIENKTERLGAVVDAARALPTWPEDARSAAALVPCCTSRVWIRGELRDGTCHFAVDCDSPLVKGLVHLLCLSADGCTADDVATARLDLLERLDLWRDLSPTRQNGLRAVQQRLAALARAWSG